MAADLYEAVAREHIADLRRDADRRRLVLLSASRRRRHRGRVLALHRLG